MALDYGDARARVERRGGLVWHYTSLDNLSLILASNSLLATEVSFLNDIRETETADEIFAEALTQLAAEGHGGFSRSIANYLAEIDAGELTGGYAELMALNNARFIICASADGDNLYAWRTYGSRGISCAIGLDPVSPLGVISLPDKQSASVQSWVEVIYTREEALQEALTLLRPLADRWTDAYRKDDIIGTSRGRGRELRDDVTEARAQLRGRAKDPAFSEENELRITTTLTRMAPVEVKISAMGPRPHVRLGAGVDGSVTVGDSSIQLPIRAIRLGPDAPQSALAGLEWLLLSHGYPMDPHVETVRDSEGEYQELPDDWERTVFLSRSMRPYRST